MKLRFSKPRFRICNNLVICTYDCTFIGPNSIESFRVSGKAKCAPEDSFDETVGRHIADSRAKKEAYTRISSYRTYFDIQYSKKRIEEELQLLNFFEKMHRLKKKEAEHIEFIIINEDFYR